MTQPHLPMVKRKSIVRPLIYSLIFIAVTSLATAILGISIASSSVGGTHSYKAIFTDVTGLIPGDEVDIAGVRVGQVTSVSVADRDLAQVDFTVQADHPLPASVTAALRWKNLAGQRYMELGQGTGPVGQTLPPGGTIPLSRTTPAVSLTDLFNGFQPLFQALSPHADNELASEIVQVFQGEGTTMQSLISSVGQLTTTLASKQKVIDAVIGNLNSVLATVSSRGSELSGMVTTLQQLVTGLAAERQPIGSAIGAISNLTNATAGLLQGIRPPLSQDITELGQLTTVLADNTPTLNHFLQTLPVKMTDIGRVVSYGSWLNLYMCSATVGGVTEEYGPAPHGIPLSSQPAAVKARCGS
jgi:phospholipid/cholesterol/gamma-HCH transport system substrate-binding protein